MNNTPLVSVLVPVYGVEKYVSECVESIFSQTYKNIEVIFVNDCTPDNSRLIIEQLISDNPHINARIIDNYSNLGLASTRNVGLDNAAGEYICFVDSDDILPNNAIEALIRSALINDSDIVRGRINRLVRSKEVPFSRQFPSNVIKFRQTILDWGKYPLGVWGGVYKRTLFRKDESYFYPGLNFGEDFGMTSRLAYLAKSISVIDDTVYVYRVNESSLTQVYVEKHASDLEEISNRIKQFYKSQPDYDVYKPFLERGRARIKTIMLFQLPNYLVKKYSKIFPDLDNVKLPLTIRLKLWSVEHNFRTLFKIFNKLEYLLHES